IVFYFTVPESGSFARVGKIRSRTECEKDGKTQGPLAALRHDALLDALHRTGRILRTETDLRPLLGVIPLPVQAPRKVTLMTPLQVLLRDLPGTALFRLKDDSPTRRLVCKSAVATRHV